MIPNDVVPPLGVFNLRYRRQLVSLSWLVVLFAVLLGLALPWYFRIGRVELTRVAWSLFAYALVLGLLGSLSERLRSRRALNLLLAGLQVGGVLFLALLWRLAGGLENPMFLAIFALPVVLAGLTLQRTQLLTTALLSILAVVTLAIMESEGLRWYLLQMPAPLPAVVELLPALGVDPATPFPGFKSTPSFELVQLEIFAVAMLALAVLVEPTRHQLFELERRVGASSSSLRETEDVLLKVLRSSPTPTVLVDVASGQVVEASESFLEQMLVRRSELEERRFLELLTFADTEAVAELVREGGEITVAAYRVGNERRVARLTSNPIEHRGGEFAYLSMEDATSLFYLEAAFDAREEPSLVVSAAGSLCYFNRAAERLFGELHLHQDVASMLDRAASEERWWLQPLATLHRVEMDGRAFLAKSVRARLPESDEAVIILTFEQETER